MATVNIMQQLEDNLLTAKAGLEQSEKAVLHYQGRVTKLTAARQALKDILGDDDEAAPSIAPRGKKMVARPARVKKVTAALKLPEDFWMEFITAQPQKLAAIFESGVTKKAVTDEADKVTMKNNLTYKLESWEKAGTVKSEGTRLNRTYFLPA